MTRALRDAGLNHAAMSEALLDQAARVEERIAYTVGRIDELYAQNAFGDDVLELDTYRELSRQAMRLREEFDRTMQGAQVHATLAGAAPTFTTELVMPEPLTYESIADVQPGSRVVWLQSRNDRKGGQMLVLATDTLGTVDLIEHPANVALTRAEPGEFTTPGEAVARITWDDGLTSDDTSNAPVPVRELRVVLGV